jgi:hypothetical protein
MLGSLNQCELSLERLRMSGGTWINARQVLLLLGGPWPEEPESIFK